MDPTSGYAFVGFENLHNDIYPAISAATNTSLHQPGKVVLITGAGRGIGRATALQYAHANVSTIILAARTASQLDEVETAIKEINNNVKVIKAPLDVTSETDVQALADKVQTAEGRLDVLINNAGTSEPWVPLVESEPAKWWSTFEINLKAPYLLSRAFLPLLLRTAEAQGGVHLVNVTSIGANLVLPSASGYMTSKLALLRLTQFLSAEYGDKGVIAVGVHPGGVETQMSKDEEQLKGKLNDTPELGGGFAVWLTASARKWLGGRYLAATWDVEKLESRQEEIVQGDKLKVKLVV